MAHADLYNRLNSLQDSIKQTSQLIIKLARSQSANGNGLELTTSSTSDGSSSQNSLNDDIHEGLKQSEEDLELLQQDIEDLAPVSQQNSGFRRVERSNIRVSERERQHGQLSATYNRLAEELKLAHARFRKAQMQAKQNADRASEKEQFAYMEDLRATAESYHAKSQESNDSTQQSYTDMRSSLFGSRKYGGRTNGSSTKDDMVLSASSDLTSSLRQTHDLLSSELSRSRFAHETLASSNSALEELNKRYGALDDLLSKSRGLLGSLLRSQKSDTWYLETAMYILLGTIAWLLFRRILYGPTWWLLWQPLRLVWKVLSAVIGVLFGIKPKAHAAGTSRSTSLTVQPSATNGPPTFSSGAAPSVRVGGGGRGGPVGQAHPDVQDRGSNTPHSDYVEGIVQGTRNPSSATGSSAQPEGTGKGDTSGTKQKEEGQSSKESEGKKDEDKEEGTIKRGDGEDLKKRDPKADPPNPKKRMWEEPKGEPKSKDEL